MKERLSNIEPSTWAGSALTGTLATQAAVAPPTEPVAQIIILVQIVIGLIEWFRRERAVRPH